MHAVDVIRRLHQHRAWVNGNLLAAAAKLNEQRLRAEFPIGQGSVWHSLTHMFGAEYVWLAALEGQASAVAPGDVAGKLPGNQLGVDRFAGMDDLQRHWQALADRWQEYLAALAPEQLDEVVCKRSSTAPASPPFCARRADVLLHVCTHAHHTTAQVLNMLRQLGAEKLPDTMLMALARQDGP